MPLWEWSVTSRIHTSWYSDPLHSPPHTNSCLSPRCLVSDQVWGENASRNYILTKYAVNWFVSQLPSRTCMSQSIYVMWIDCGIELLIHEVYLVVTVVLCWSSTRGASVSLQRFTFIFYFFQKYRLWNWSYAISMSLSREQGVGMGGRVRGHVL